jgi:hypothetical protein
VNSRGRDEQACSSIANEAAAISDLRIEPPSNAQPVRARVMLGRPDRQVKLLRENDFCRGVQQPGIRNLPNRALRITILRCAGGPKSC